LQCHAAIVLGQKVRRISLVVNRRVRTVESLQAVRLNHKKMAFANRIYVFDFQDMVELAAS
jgi:hypothetical protein